MLLGYNWAATLVAGHWAGSRGWVGPTLGVLCQWIFTNTRGLSSYAPINSIQASQVVRMLTNPAIAVSVFLTDWQQRPVVAVSADHPTGA